MTTLRLTLSLLFLTTFAVPLRGADVWVVRGSESSYNVELCSVLATQSEVLLQNSSATDASVKLISVSNGGSTSPDEVLVPATRTVTLSTYGVPIWIAPARWWTVHIQVPDGVATSARLQFGSDRIGCPPTAKPPTFSPNRGTVSIPVFRSLVAAGAVQRHLGTYVSAGAATVSAIVFNDADSQASAHVQLYRACDDTVVAERTLTIAAKSTDSVDLPLHPDCLSPARETLASGFDYYTIVTVNQRSLSMVVTTSKVPAPANDIAVGDIVIAPQGTTRVRAVHR